jgi:hypothetical protein
MRSAIASAVLALMCASAMTGCSLPRVAAEVPPPPSPTVYFYTTVYLYTSADFDDLRETNFDHYLRTQKILSAANEICRPGPPQYLTRFDGADPRCGYMWMTSYPPKKMLSFRLDTVRYIALVTITNLPDELVKIDLQR